MKNLKLLMLLLLAIPMTAQTGFRLGDTEYFTASISVDPAASVKEKGLNLVAEVEVVSYWKYVKLSIQEFAILEGGYLDASGGLGVNVTSGYFNQWRGYAGFRLGLIARGNYNYPLSGTEIGLDYNLENLFIGLRATGDYRTDFKFSGAEPEMVYSGFIRIGAKF